MEISGKTFILRDLDAQQLVSKTIAENIPLHLLWSGLAFSPDGKIIAYSGANRTIVLWNTVKEEPIGQPLSDHALLGYGDTIHSLTFSPDGRILASGVTDGNIFLWDMSTNNPTGTPVRGHTGPVVGLAFNPNGEILASGSYDKTIRLWDVRIQKPILQLLTGHSSAVSILIFSPDGKVLVSGGLDKSVILWDFNPQSWLQKTCQRVGRNFTQTEWELYFPGEEYRTTCPQWPAGE